MDFEPRCNRIKSNRIRINPSSAIAPSPSPPPHPPLSLPPRSKLPSWVRLFVTSRDEVHIKRALIHVYEPLELRVDEGRNQQDVRAVLSNIASKYVKATMSVADIELACEAKFPGLKGTMAGKLGGLEEPMRLAIAAHEQPMVVIRQDPDYEELVAVEELRPAGLKQTAPDFDSLMEESEAAQDFLTSSIAAAWEPMIKGKEYPRKPVAGQQKTWVFKAVDPGVKRKERAELKMIGDYGGDHTKLKDLARMVSSEGWSEE